MFEEFLLQNIAKSLDYIDEKYLQELRIRALKPTTICYNAEFYYLGTNGIVNKKDDAIIPDMETIEKIVLKISNYSLYTVNDDIKNGFITLSNGIRVGIVGQVVKENENIITVNNLSSLNIRFPHQIKNSSDKIMQYLFLNDQDFLNTLIISPPGAGKTTLLRDITRNLASKYAKNVLVIDERNEISASKQGINQLDLGDFCDIYVDCDKNLGIRNAIRSMNPNIIIVDELASPKDIENIQYASTCGVKILATIHAFDTDDLKNKLEFSIALKNKIFDRYVVLSERQGKGTIEKIFDKDFGKIY